MRVLMVGDITVSPVTCSACSCRPLVFVCRVLFVMGEVVEVVNGQFHQPPCLVNVDKRILECLREDWGLAWSMGAGMHGSYNLLSVARYYDVSIIIKSDGLIELFKEVACVYSSISSSHIKAEATFLLHCDFIRPAPEFLCP